MAILEPEEQQEFVDYLNKQFEAVDQEAYDRHIEGGQKYGPLKFLTADTLEEALAELYDLINYARYTAVKVKMLQEFLSNQAAAADEPDTTGAGHFLSTSELMKGFHKS